MRSVASCPGAALGRRRCRGRERGPAITSETPGLRYPPPARAPGGSPVSTIAYELDGIKVILSRWFLSLCGAAAALQGKDGDHHHHHDKIGTLLIPFYPWGNWGTEQVCPSSKCLTEEVTKSGLEPKTV